MRQANRAQRMGSQPTEQSNERGNVGLQCYPQPLESESQSRESAVVAAATSDPEPFESDPQSNRLSPALLIGSTALGPCFGGGFFLVGCPNRQAHASAPSGPSDASGLKQIQQLPIFIGLVVLLLEALPAAALVLPLDHDADHGGAMGSCCCACIGTDAASPGADQRHDPLGPAPAPARPGGPRWTKPFEPDRAPAGAGQHG